MDISNQANYSKLYISTEKHVKGFHEIFLFNYFFLTVDGFTSQVDKNFKPVIGQF